MVAPFTTSSPSANGGFIRVDDYTITASLRQGGTRTLDPQIITDPPVPPIVIGGGG